MDLLIDASHAYASLLRSIQPYIGMAIRAVAPGVPWLTYGIGVALEVLSPLLHTLRLVFLTLSSYGIRGLTSILLSLPPALHPVLILGLLLFGLYVALAVMSLMRRATAFLLRLLFNAALLSVAVGAAAYLYQRGLAQTLDDARGLADLLATWWAEGERRGKARKVNWQNEGYRKEKDWVDAARRARYGAAAGGGGGAGGGWWQ